MSNRRTYHTCLKDLVRMGLCPSYIEARIPRANVHRWRNESENKYYGRNEIQIESFQSLLINIDQHPGFFFACGRLLNTLKAICDQSRDFKKQLYRQKERVVKAISSSIRIIPLKSAIQIFGISRNTYYTWKVQCKLSPIKLCKKRFGLQLTANEVAALEKLLTLPMFRHWGISSIHLWAKRNNVIHASLNTWYKYNRIFRWRRMEQRYRKATYQPLRATHPNEYWHADVSIHQCLNGEKGYIYTIMDNASRKILSWKVADRLSGEIMKEVLTKVTRDHKCSPSPKLVVDGGSENFNISMNRVLEEKQIIRLRATADIKQSNSMIEAVFRQLKHQYLLRKSVQNLSQLQERVNFFFTDSNQNKPLKVLNGLTPDEAHEGVTSFKDIALKDEAKQAIRKRIKENKKKWCLSCTT